VIFRWRSCKEGLLTDDVRTAYATKPTMFAQMKLGKYAVPSLEAMLARKR
jgi:hypothetical protein